MKERIVTRRGHIDPGGPDWVYVPFEAPEGVTGLRVEYEYNRDDNALDVGIFGPSGFRGWSGGYRSGFEVSRSRATPGYIPGEIEPGEWNIIFGPYEVAPGGIDWTAEITLEYGDTGPAFEPNPAPSEARDTEPGWYRGDLHVHTVYSDGGYTPEDIVNRARKAGLDFVVSTEHNTSAANLIWGEHTPPDLLVISGEEVSTRAGHCNAIGLPPGRWIDWRYRPEDGVSPVFLDDIHTAGALAVANHPFAPCRGCAWEFGYENLDAIEVWNDPWTPDDEEAVRLWDGLLREGKIIPAVGGSDAHRPGDEIGLPQTVARLDRLSRDAVVSAIGAGRSYIAGSAEVELEMKVELGRLSAGIGERLEAASGAPVEVSLRVRGATGTMVIFHTAEGAVETARVSKDDEVVDYTAVVRGYARAEVRRPDGAMAALTNPVWIQPE